MCRKRGKQIKQNLKLVPIGIKGNEYEIRARTALVAIENNCANIDHIVSLYVLARLSESMSRERYILLHAAAIKEICVNIYDNEYYCIRMVYKTLKISADVLLCWILKQNNIKLAKHALKAVNEIDEWKKVL